MSYLILKVISPVIPKITNAVFQEKYIVSVQVERGKSAYQVWLENGNTGSEPEFLDSLKGDNGTSNYDALENKPEEKYSTAEKTKLFNLPTGAGLQVLLDDKASKFISINGQSLEADVTLEITDINGSNTKVDVVAGKQLSTEDYTTSEKTKLTNIQANATSNSSDAFLLNRPNHTGGQNASTITDFGDAVALQTYYAVDKLTPADNDRFSFWAILEGGFRKLTWLDIKNIIKTLITKSQVGLSNVDNTSDASKPISAAQQTALNLKVNTNSVITGATKTKITYDVKGLVTVGADATTADIAASTNKNYVTDAQQAVIGNTSGTNTGDQDLSGLAVKSNNLSDLTNASTARTNLGLGTLATQNGAFSGTSSGTNTGDETTSRINSLYGYTPANAATVATNTSDIATKATKAGEAGGQTINGGTLTTQNLTLQPNAANTTTGSIISNGKIIFGTDNTYDIGASGATRPKDYYGSGNVTAGGSLVASTGNVYLSNGSSNGAIQFSQATIRARGITDGVIQLFNSTANGFDRLQFGGTTNSFPSLKRSNADLLVKDASDGTSSGFGVGVSSINAAAVLEISSTTKGVLLPRMTTTQRDAISSPAEGLEIYNLTTHTKNFYNGTVWKAVITD